MTDWTAHRIPDGPLRGVTLETRHRSILATLARMVGLAPRRQAPEAGRPAEADAEE